MGRVSKGWSKGLRASDDARVARAAAAHRGRTYRRVTSFEEGRWRRPAPLVTLGWSADMAYAVGLLATDGCLTTGRRRIQFGSEDRELVERLLAALHRPTPIREQRTRAGRPYFRVQFGDARFYEWLLAQGLTPRKSLTLGAIPVPPEHLLALVRGLLDGDGSITRGPQRADTGGRTGYRWDHLAVSFNSSSEAHIDWLRRVLGAQLGIAGSVGRSERPGRAPAFRLRYGKRASVTLLSALYRDPAAPALTRKRLVWLGCERTWVSGHAASG